MMSSKVAAQIAVTFILVVGVSGWVPLAPQATRGDILLPPAVETPRPEPTRFRAVVTVTAYSSSPDETWGDPLITASGRPVADGVVACPRLFPFGTKFRIGRAVYTCLDRLHQKYDHGFDICKQEALEFGRQRLQVEVL